MQKIIAFALLILLINSGCSLLGYKKLSEEELKNITDKIKKSKVLVLDVYHKNCESCKYIEPIIKELEKRYLGNSDIVFLKYDITNPFTILSSRQIAQASGLEKIYKSQRFSGVVHIISSKDKRILASLVADYDINNYIDLIEKGTAPFIEKH